MSEHTALVSAKCHEPKHITNTTVADAGKVITAAATSGTSEFRALTPEEVGIPNVIGSMEVNASTDAISVSAAVDSTLYDKTEYTQILAADTTTIAPLLIGGMTFDSVNNELIVPVGGYYAVTDSCTITATGAHAVVAIANTLNGVVTSVVQVSKHHIDASTDPVRMSGTSVYLLPLGTSVGFSINSDKATDYVVQDYRMTIHLLREI